MKATIVLILTLFVLTRAQDEAADTGPPKWTFDYSQNGDNWGALVAPDGDTRPNRCGVDTNQSPINLLDPIGSYGWAYGDAVPKSEDDVKPSYKDLTKELVVDWDDTTVKVDLHEVESRDNFFTSNIGETKYEAATTKWLATQFHFHAPSEHTHNGEYYDLEMQVIHEAQTWNETRSIKYAGVAVFFDSERFDPTITEDQNATVERFFENLKFEDHTEPTVDTVTLGKMMDVLEFEDRWTYKGSLTTPPCEQYVYWNIMRKVYPILPEQLQHFKDKIALNQEAVGGLTNNRHIQSISNHNILYVGARYLSKIAAVTVPIASSLVIWALN